MEPTPITMQWGHIFQHCAGVAASAVFGSRLSMPSADANCATHYSNSVFTDSSSAPTQSATTHTDPMALRDHCLRSCAQLHVAVLYPLLMCQHPPFQLRTRSMHRHQAQLLAVMEVTAYLTTLASK
eukprot:1924610-Pleurochrysis_carterae.AAC.1